MALRTENSISKQLTVIKQFRTIPCDYQPLGRFHRKAVRINSGTPVAITSVLWSDSSENAFHGDLSI